MAEIALATPPSSPDLIPVIAGPDPAIAANSGACRDARIKSSHDQVKNFPSKLS
jgi:hypothetical protein